MPILQRRDRTSLIGRRNKESRWRSRKERIRRSPEIRCSYLLIAVEAAAGCKRIGKSVVFWSFHKERQGHFRNFISTMAYGNSISLEMN